jgi:hypothetical protein
MEKPMQQTKQMDACMGTASWKEIQLRLSADIKE